MIFWSSSPSPSTAPSLRGFLLTLGALLTAGVAGGRSGPGSRRTLDGHRADPVAPPGEALRGQPEARHDRRRPGDGHPAERVREQAADGFHVLRLDADAEQFL